MWGFGRQTQPGNTTGGCSCSRRKGPPVLISNMVDAELLLRVAEGDTVFVRAGVLWCRWTCSHSHLECTTTTRTTGVWWLCFINTALSEKNTVPSAVGCIRREWTVVAFKSFLAASGKRPPSCSLLFLYLFITSHISFSPFHNAHTDGQGLMPGTSISPWLGAGYWGWRRRRWWRRERHLLLKDKDE